MAQKDWSAYRQQSRDQLMSNVPAMEQSANKLGQAYAAQRQREEAKAESNWLGPTLQGAVTGFMMGGAPGAALGALGGFALQDQLRQPGVAQTMMPLASMMGRGAGGLAGEATGTTGAGSGVGSLTPITESRGLSPGNLSFDASLDPSAGMDPEAFKLALGRGGSGFRY